MATISENLQTILDIKNDIKDAIIAKGVSVADSDGFATYPSKIESIETGIASIDVAAIGLKFGNSIFTEVPSIFDFSNVTDMSDMFSVCRNFTSTPSIDTSNVTNMDSMFHGCSNLTSVIEYNTISVTDMSNMFSGCSNLTTVPLLNTSNVNDMTYMFYYCSKLTSIPQFNTSNVTDMFGMFEECKSLTTIPSLDTRNVTSIGMMFSNCKNLVSLPLLNFEKVGANETTGLVGLTFLNYCSNLQDVAGFYNLGKSFIAKQYIVFKSCSKLTRQSCLNIFNNLYNVSNYSFTPEIELHANTYSLLSTNDIAIATNKGWSVVSA